MTLCSRINENLNVLKMFNDFAFASLEFQYFYICVLVSINSEIRPTNGTVPEGFILITTTIFTFCNFISF